MSGTTRAAAALLSILAVAGCAGDGGGGTGSEAPGAELPACDPDDGGLSLPDGFCATVVAEDVGEARHLTVAPNGDVYVAVYGTDSVPGGVVALRDTTGDGKADVRKSYDLDGGTGISLHDGYLYVAPD
ncbi:MAG: sorbosone dehydrogenase, partial [Gemmatimonadota bacterium]